MLVEETLATTAGKMCMCSFLLLAGFPSRDDLKSVSPLSEVFGNREIMMNELGSDVAAEDGGVEFDGEVEGEADARIGLPREDEVV